MTLAAASAICGGMSNADPTKWSLINLHDHVRQWGVETEHGSGQLVIEGLTKAQALDYIAQRQPPPPDPVPAPPAE